MRAATAGWLATLVAGAGMALVVAGILHPALFMPGIAVLTVGLLGFAAAGVLAMREHAR